MRRPSACLALLLLGAVAALAQDAGQAIRLNQLGFYPQGPKVAVVAAAGPFDTFVVTTADGADTVWRGEPGPPRTWPYSGEQVQLLDFSGLTRPGRYTLRLPRLGASLPFDIRAAVHASLAQAALKGFYYQRASTTLPEEYAGPWQRAAGHPDTDVRVHASAADTARPEGTRLSSPGGWYDAGDYNKYIVNAGITLFSLLTLLERYPAYVTDLSTNIPGSGDALPDLLNEALWELRWMLTMQDRRDGGVYHKLTHARFSGFVLPAAARAPRYVVQKTTAATLDFAAVTAQAARVLTAYEAQIPGLADSLTAAAAAAWTWARRHPRIFYDQEALNDRFDPDIATGPYRDSRLGDEFHWAATELYITTGQDSFLAAVPDLFDDPNTYLPWWGGVGTLGFYSLAIHAGEIAADDPGRGAPAVVAAVLDTTLLRDRLVGWVDWLIADRPASAYGVIMGRLASDFGWGSNATAANQGIAALEAFRLTGRRLYLEAAIANLDYLLGRNALGLSFVTGVGQRTPMFPHHRPSAADRVEAPVPGLLVGGPNPQQQDRCAGYPSDLPAASYLDDTCSYASNEIAINWQAALAHLVIGVEAVMAGLPAPETAVTGAGGGDAAATRPRRSRLLPSYPNPFNSSTVIPFETAAAGPVQVTLFDALGRKVRTLVTGPRPAGYHTVSWHGRDDAGRIVASGTYLVELRTGSRRQSRELTLAR